MCDQLSVRHFSSPAGSGELRLSMTVTESMATGEEPAFGSLLRELRLAASLTIEGLAGPPE